jgi:hypothetical protein
MQISSVEFSLFLIAGAIVSAGWMIATAIRQLRSVFLRESQGRYAQSAAAAASSTGGLSSLNVPDVVHSEHFRVVTPVWRAGGIRALRRAEIGQHHRISGHLLHQYANEAAWREDNRRKPNGTNWNAVIRTCRPTGSHHGKRARPSFRR